MEFDLHGYDYYLVSFSGGKDSVSSVLDLLDQGVPRERIELWHCCIDGAGRCLFDWEVTESYCREFGKAFGIPVYFMWKDGGFEREMLRQNALTAPITFQLPDGTLDKAGGTRGKLSTRLKFPQPSPDLMVRWCSAYLKIDVFSTALINQERFRGKRTLVISGERAEESPQRARYKQFEPDRTDLRSGKRFRRHVDRYRPVLLRPESWVWEIIERYRIRVHPCYYMGWSRCSCKFCIFSNKHQMASAARVSPEQMDILIAYEEQFHYTMKRDTDLCSLIESGTPYPSITQELINLATSHYYSSTILIPEEELWILPAGAYGEGCGPS